jgi:hypothetical protein
VPAGDEVRKNGTPSAPSPTGTPSTPEPVNATAESTRERTEVEALLAARVPLPSADEQGVYVGRPELEGVIKAFVREAVSQAGTYLIVVGERGAGKTTVVDHALSQLDSGALVVPLDEMSSMTSDLDALIMRAALKQYNAQAKSSFASSEPLPGGYLAERLAEAKNPLGEGKRVTIVLDVQQSSNGPLIRTACARLKKLAHDKPLCHAILVLSSSFAAAELTLDPARQTFVRVGAFSSRAQARGRAASRPRRART